MDKDDKEHIGCLIFTVIVSIFFGVIEGIYKCSLWWGIGVTIGCFILFIIGWGFGDLMDAIDDELHDRFRNK